VGEGAGTAIGTHDPLDGAYLDQPCMQVPHNSRRERVLFQAGAGQPAAFRGVADLQANHRPAAASVDSGAMQ
jgi:hypothetical protein